jgi:hypothetical protein
MARNPATVWYWNDSENNKQLTTCSMAAQGLWQRMLAIMAAATPQGYLKLGNDPCSISDLAIATGQHRRSISGWVRELEKKGVFSRAEDGTIFCRRMVREAEQGARHKRVKKAHTSRSHQTANQRELFEKATPKTEENAPPLDSGCFAASQDSPLPDKPETLNAAREQEGKEGQAKVEGNPEEARCARLGGSGEPPCQGGADPPINETPVRTGLAGANRGGTDDARTSLPPPVADPNRLGSRDQARTDPLAGSASSPSTRFGALRGCDPAVQPEPDTPKTRMPARLADRHRDGECDAVPSQAPASDYRGVDCENQGHGAPIAGGGQPETVDLSRRGMAPPGPCPRTAKSPNLAPQRKSAALRTKIRDQLISKHARFLDARRPPEELAAYWAAMLGDDAAVAQSMFDAVDRCMRQAGWDDMRQWKLRRTGWVAVGEVA